MKILVFENFLHNPGGEVENGKIYGNRTHLKTRVTILVHQIQDVSLQRNKKSLHNFNTNEDTVTKFSTNFDA